MTWLASHARPAAWRARQAKKTVKVARHDLAQAVRAVARAEAALALAQVAAAAVVHREPEEALAREAPHVHVRDVRRRLGLSLIHI